MNWSFTTIKSYKNENHKPLLETCVKFLSFMYLLRKLARPCAAKLFEHYQLVVRLAFFFVFAMFGAAAITNHVKHRVPAAAPSVSSPRRGC